MVQIHVKFQKVVTPPPQVVVGSLMGEINTDVKQEVVVLEGDEDKLLWVVDNIRKHVGRGIFLKVGDVPIHISIKFRVTMFQGPKRQGHCICLQHWRLHAACGRSEGVWY